MPLKNPHQQARALLGWSKKRPTAWKVRPLWKQESRALTRGWFTFSCLLDRIVGLLCVSLVAATKVVQYTRLRFFVKQITWEFCIVAILCKFWAAWLWPCLLICVALCSRSRCFHMRRARSDRGQLFYTCFIFMKPIVFFKLHVDPGCLCSLKPGFFRWKPLFENEIWNPARE